MGVVVEKRKKVKYYIDSESNCGDNPKGIVSGCRNAMAKGGGDRAATGGGFGGVAAAIATERKTLLAANESSKADALHKNSASSAADAVDETKNNAANTASNRGGKPIVCIQDEVWYTL